MPFNVFNYELRHALVAGGAGFVGSHLCRKLLSLGYKKVICIDNLCTGSLKKINDLIGDQRFTFINNDITNLIEIDDDLNEIFNLACPASPEKEVGLEKIL